MKDALRAGSDIGYADNQKIEKLECAVVPDGASTNNLMTQMESTLDSLSQTKLAIIITQSFLYDIFQAIKLEKGGGDVR